MSQVKNPTSEAEQWLMTGKALGYLSTHLLRASFCTNRFTAFWLASRTEWRVACSRLADLLGAPVGAPFRFPVIAGELMYLDV